MELEEKMGIGKWVEGDAIYREVAVGENGVELVKGLGYSPIGRIVDLNGVEYVTFLLPFCNLGGGGEKISSWVGRLKEMRVRYWNTNRDISR